MKKARIILTLITLLAIAGGGVAFKAMRFTTDQVFTPTSIVYYYAPGVTYYRIGNFCTSVNRWIHPTLGVPAVVWHLEPIIIGTYTMYQWPTGPATTTVIFWLCTQITTRTTTME